MRLKWSEWSALLWLGLALFLGWACAVWLLSEGRRSRGPCVRLSASGVGCEPRRFGAG